MLIIKNFLKEKNIHRVFEVAVILKGIHAIIEIVGGFLILLITQSFVTNFVFSITQEELGEDPKDFIAHYLINSAQHFSIGSQHFAAFYLLSHGIIKIILVAGLLKEKLWAYPASLGVFGLFIVYQLYRFSFTHSIWLLALTVLDVGIIALTWHEYKYIKKHKTFSGV